MFVNLDLGPFQVTCYCLRCFIFTPYEKFGKFNTISDKGRVCTMELMDTSDPLEGGGGDVILRLEYQVCSASLPKFCHQDFVLNYVAIGGKHRKNCECCPVSQLIVRSQRVS